MGLSKTRKYNRKSRRVQKKNRTLRRSKYMRRTRSKRGGGIGNDQRYALVQFWKRRRCEDYLELAKKILNSHRKGRRDFFDYLDREMIPSDTKQGFSVETLIALYYFLHLAQEDAIPESWKYMPYVYKQVALSEGHDGDEQTLQQIGQTSINDKLTRWLANCSN